MNTSLIAKVKAKEDIDVLLRINSRLDFSKIKSLPSIDFIIPKKFKDMMGKINLLSLMLPKMIEELE